MIQEETPQRSTLANANRPRPRERCLVCYRRPAFCEEHWATVLHCEDCSTPVLIEARNNTLRKIRRGIKKGPATAQVLGVTLKAYQAWVAFVEKRK